MQCRTKVLQLCKRRAQYDIDIAFQPIIHPNKCIGERCFWDSSHIAEALALMLFLTYEVYIARLIYPANKGAAAGSAVYFPFEWRIGVMLAVIVCSADTNRLRLFIGLSRNDWIMGVVLQGEYFAPPVGRFPNYKGVDTMCAVGSNGCIVGA